MPKTIVRAFLLLVLIIISMALGTASTALLAQQERLEGLFGRVTRITTPSPGRTLITLDATEGSQTVEAAETTIVRIPGREIAAASDISPGNFLAVLARGDGRLVALSILVKPKLPVLHTHIVGSKVGQVGHQVIIMDKDGNKITVDPFLTDREFDPGQVVTAVVRQELDSGGFFMLGAESAEEKAGRLVGALNKAIEAGASENQRNLSKRLDAHTTGQFTTLQEINNRVGQDIRFIFTDALEAALTAHQAQPAKFGLGPPAIKLTGVIEDIDLAEGTVVVSPLEGPRIRLKLTSTTLIRVFGTDRRIENLMLGHHIESRYNPRTREALNVDAVFPTLREELTASLLAQARRGELEGTVSELDATAEPPVVVVKLATGTEVSLTTTPETRILVREEQAELRDLAPLLQVKVRYDPATMEALEIETFDVQPNQAFISGVVQSFKPKFGKISITSVDGEILTLDIKEDVFIERDRLRIPFGLVRFFGDLVRPTTRYNTVTGEVQKLVLKVAGLQGIVRGKTTTPGGRNTLTISTDELNLVTVEVKEAADFEVPQVGDRVSSRVYNAVAQQASAVAVRPPRALRITGTISNLDRQDFVVTVTPAEGEPIQLLVPNKPGKLIILGEPKGIFQDLEVGDEVRAALYRPDRVVIKIVVKRQ